MTKNAHPIPMSFCKRHSYLAVTISAVIYEPEPPRVIQDHPSEPKVAKSKVTAKPTQSMAAWVRDQSAKGLGAEDIAAALPTAFPDSKPGLNPKLSKGYVNCYLKK